MFSIFVKQIIDKQLFLSLHWFISYINIVVFVGRITKRRMLWFGYGLNLSPKGSFVGRLICSVVMLGGGRTFMLSVYLG
jgi:hypothetical protein